MTQQVLYAIMMIAIGANFLVTAFMAWKSFDMVIQKCQCATENRYWYSIFVYLLASFALVIYSILATIEYIHPKVYQELLIAYVIATIGFVFGSMQYTKVMKSTQCDCMDPRFKEILSFMILLRYLGVIAITIGLLIFGIYVFFYNK